MGRAEVVEAAFATADDVDGFFATARANEEFWTGGWGWFGRVSTIGRFIFFGFISIFFKMSFDDDIFNWKSGLFAGGAIVNIDPALVEPEFDFFVASLLSRWHLEDVDVGFFTTVEITDDDVGKFGEGAWANVTTDVVFVFVHEEESVSAVEILIERGVNVSKILGIVAFG